MEDQNGAEPDAASAPFPRNADTAAASPQRPNRRKLRSREKLRVLVKTLKPIPFRPSKALDFTSHESLLRRLGLWDFVHIEFDSSIRSDLLAQLIAGYSPTLRSSYVNGIKIMINRADLGRALKLPAEKTAITEDGIETLDLAESVAFTGKLVSIWMLLHEDAYIMPPEVLACTKLIKEGHLEKIDWAGLIWIMIDKELKAPQLVNCYYASHLQHLIKTQHEELLREEPKVDIEARDEEEEQEDEDGSGDVKMGGVDDCWPHELEEHNIELSLGQGNVEHFEVEKEQVGGEQIMDFEESKEGEPFLRQCNVGDLKSWDCGQKKDEEGEDGQEGEEEEEEEEEEEVGQCNVCDLKSWDCGQKKDEEGEDGQEGEEEEEEEEEATAEEEDDEHKGGFHHLSPECIPLVGMSSGSLIQAMEVEQLPFSSGIELRANSVGDFPACREDAQMVSGVSLFHNGHKRDIGHYNHNLHQSPTGSNKRLRSDVLWDAKPVDFDMCMEHMQHWMGKARMMYATKEQACEDSSMNQQLLLNELQKRDSMIEHLHKAKLEESRKRQVEVYRLERELYIMADLLEGYRKALKETQNAFAQYRARCPQANEPLYKDVPGSGGLVLSVMELEKDRLKEEEERMKRLVIEKKLRDVEGSWIRKLEDHQNRIQSLGKRLLVIEDEAKLLNKVKVKCKVLDPPECAPGEGQTV